MASNMCILTITVTVVIAIRFTNKREHDELQKVNINFKSSHILKTPTPTLTVQPTLRQMASFLFLNLIKANGGIAANGSHLAAVSEERRLPNRPGKGVLQIDVIRPSLSRFGEEIDVAVGRARQ